MKDGKIQEVGNEGTVEVNKWILNEIYKSMEEGKQRTGSNKEEEESWTENI